MTRQAWTYDAEADCAYITLSDAPIAKTWHLDSQILVDLDADGRVIGVELIGLKGLMEGES